MNDNDGYIELVLGIFIGAAVVVIIALSAAHQTAENVCESRGGTYINGKCLPFKELK